MAKIERVTVGYSARMSQDYHSVEGSASLEILLEDGELASEVMAKYRPGLRTLVNADVAREMVIMIAEADKLKADRLKAERDAKLRLKEAA